MIFNGSSRVMDLGIDHGSQRVTGCTWDEFTEKKLAIKRAIREATGLKIPSSWSLEYADLPSLEDEKAISKLARGMVRDAFFICAICQHAKDSFHIANTTYDMYYVLNMIQNFGFSFFGEIHVFIFKVGKDMKRIKLSEIHSEEDMEKEKIYFPRIHVVS